MNKGDIVIVKDFRGRSLRRVVWEKLGTSVAVCTESDYKDWKETGSEPRVVGFPFVDVKLLETEFVESEA